MIEPTGSVILKASVVSQGGACSRIGSSMCRRSELKRRTSLAGVFSTVALRATMPRPIRG